MYINLGMEEDLAIELVEGQGLNNWRTVQGYRYGADRRIESLFKGISKVEQEDEDGNTVRIKVPEQQVHRFGQLMYYDYADYQRRRLYTDTAPAS
jgi:hypothetical protein